MIDKFISIKNIGVFRDYSARGDVSLRRLTLVFAENGRGKTTLCAVLRSLQTGRPEFVSERKTLGLNGESSVEMLLEGQKFSFSNNEWSGTHADIAIFDSVFIHNNVYAGDYVDHNHKKNLYRVVVGTEGARLATQVEELDGKIRDASTDIRAKKETVQKALPNGVTIEVYLAWQPIEDVENKILRKSTEIANRQRALDKAAEIGSRALLAKIQLPIFPSDFLATLAKQLKDVNADAGKRVREQIANHNMGKEGEPWLSQGLGYVAHNKCPFCGQDISANELIIAYQSHFNAVYRALKQEVAKLSQRIADTIGETSLHVTQQTLSGNLTLAEFWRQFTPQTLPALSFEEIQQKYAKLRERSLALSKRKQENPTDPVSPDDGFRTSLEAVRALDQPVQAYNAAVDASNVRINQQKAFLQRGADINTMKGELADLQANKRRFEPDVAQACHEFQSAVEAKEKLVKEKEAAKRQLDEYCENVLPGYEKAINNYLDQFHTGFRIVKSRRVYTGGTPSSEYQIDIRNTSVDLGDPKTPSGTPCFKTTLSSGDRSALALAFFLAALKQDPAIGNKIVVLDDPFTSLDRFRRTCTQQLIRKLAANARQVIVLSHDPHFLKLVWEGYPANEIKTLKLFPTGDNTAIGEFDIEAETQCSYLRNYSTLQNFSRDRTGTAIGVARAIRPFLEGLLRSHFPGRFEHNECLGGMISKIRNADPSQGLNHARADLPELEAINNYSKKYHHDQNPNADSEVLSENELHGFVERALRFVGGH